MEVEQLLEEFNALGPSIVKMAGRREDLNSWTWNRATSGCTREQRLSVCVDKICLPQQSSVDYCCCNMEPLQFLALEFDDTLEWRQERQTSIRLQGGPNCKLANPVDPDASRRLRDDLHNFQSGQRPHDVILTTTTVEKASTPSSVRCGGSNEKQWLHILTADQEGVVMFLLLSSSDCKRNAMDLKQGGAYRFRFSGHVRGRLRFPGEQPGWYDAPQKIGLWRLRCRRIFSVSANGTGDGCIPVMLGGHSDSSRCVLKLGGDTRVLVANGCCGILENSLFDGATKDFTNVYSVSAFRTAEEEKATAEELVNHFCETPRIPGCFTSMAISKNSGRPLPAAGGRSGYQVPCILCATP